MSRILIADDQKDVLAALRLLLKGNRFEIETASSPAAVLDIVNSQELDVVLIDLNYARDTTSGSEGLDLLTRIQAVDPTLPVVVMTAWGSVDVAAVRRLVLGHERSRLGQAAALIGEDDQVRELGLRLLCVFDAFHRNRDDAGVPLFEVRMATFELIQLG